MKQSPNWDPNARGYRADVTVAEDRKRLFADLAKDFGKLNIVFANAGIGGRTPTGATDEAVFENIVHTNLNGAFFTVNSAAPLLNDNASIIFNGSVHNYLGQAGQAAYAATKGGVGQHMARAIAADFAPRNIRVNVVAPEATKTPIWKRGSGASMSAEQSAKLADLYSSTVPLGRWGEPEELAKAVLFLASEDSSYINAVELMVDGGVTGAPLELLSFAVDRTESTHGAKVMRVRFVPPQPISEPRYWVRPEKGEKDERLRKA